MGNSSTNFDVTDEVTVLPPDAVQVTVVKSESQVLEVLNEDRVLVVQT